MLLEETITETSADVVKQEEELAAPVNGTILSLSEVKDPVFAGGGLGKGSAILPDDGTFYAPCDGTVETAYHHAVGMMTDQGAEVFIHVGLDTVKLEGKFFELFVKTGDRVKKGDLLIKADLNSIMQEGYDVTTMVLVTNSNDYADILTTEEKKAVAGNCMIRCIPR